MKGPRSAQLRGVSRTPLRDQIYRILLEQLTSGALAAGTRLRDVSLAESLAVSRTPVREALLRLEREGFLLADHHRGFSVRRFDEREIRETYPLVWVLEVLALREGAPHSPEVITRLEEINRAMRSSRTSIVELAQLDQEWHEALALGSGNERLVALLSPLKGAIQRYERAYMRARKDVQASVAEHEAIVEALRRRRTGAAAQLLERHWRRGMDALFRRQRATGAH